MTPTSCKQTLHSLQLGQNICRLFHFLAQFVFTTCEKELDYLHKVNVRAAERAAERPET